MALTDRDWYFAGLFDGEGAVTCSISQGQLQLSMRLGMYTSDAVKAMHARFGGSYYITPRSRGKTAYTWCVFSGNCLPVIAAFSDKCIVKHDVIMLAQPLAQAMRDGARSDTPEGRAWRLSIAQEICAINAGGLPKSVFNKTLTDSYINRKRNSSAETTVVGLGVYPSRLAAAKAIGVSKSAFGTALRRGRPIAGYKILPGEYSRPHAGFAK